MEQGRLSRRGIRPVYELLYCSQDGGKSCQLITANFGRYIILEFKEFTMDVIHFEMNSFTWKFNQLTSLGVNSNLSFKSVDGKISVNLEAELGIYYPQPPHVEPQHFFGDLRPQTKHARRTRKRKCKPMIINSVKEESNAIVNNDVCDKVSPDPVEESDVSPVSPVLEQKTESLMNVCSEAFYATTRKFSCENCSKMFLNNSQLEEHYSVYEFGCEICGICYETNMLAQLHELEKHPYSEDAADVPGDVKLLFDRGSRAPT